MSDWQKSKCNLKKFKALFIFILLIFNFCEPETRIPDSVEVGMNKSEVKQLLGVPPVTDTVVKDTEIIWGAEEAFWDELPMETRLDIWRYDLNEEELRLYFIDGGDSLAYKIVAPIDAVYESVE